MDEDKLKQGRDELHTLMIMFKRWVKSDFDWAVDIINKQGSTGEEKEWDFLRREWIDKLESWIGPFISRLLATKYVTENDVRKFGEEAAHTMKIMLKALYALGGSSVNE
jgi:hypothetical protein